MPGIEQGDRIAVPVIAITEVQYLVSLPNGYVYELTAWVDTDRKITEPRWIWLLERQGGAYEPLSSSEYFTNHESAYADAVANLGWLV